MALIGRRSELAALTAALSALRSGHGRAFVLLGASGSGKTAVAEAFAAQARDASVRVLWMAGKAMPDGARCWPWPAIVRELGGAQELVDRLSDGDGGAPAFEAVAAVLGAEADRQPAVLVVDDADTVDETARDLLVFVAEQLRLRSIAVLATARDPQRIKRLRRSAAVIELQGLDVSAVREMLALSGVVVEGGVCSAVMRLTGGLPGELSVLVRELSTGPANCVDDVFRITLDLADTALRTEGRAAGEPIARRLVAARDLASPQARGEVALFVHRLGGTTSTTADDRVALIDEALTALGDDEDAIAMRAQLHAALARELYHGDVLREDRDPGTEAATGWVLAQQSGDAVTLAWCLRARHDIEWRPGTAASRRALIDDIVALLDGTSRREELADALLTRFAVYLELGDARFDREFDRFLQVAARDPTPRLRHVVLSRRAMRALLAGDLLQAEQLIDAAAASARKSGEPDGAVVALNQRFELYAEHGDRSPLLPVLERFRAVSSHPAIVASVALARLDANDLDGARVAVAPFEDVSLDRLQPEYGKAWVLSMLGEAFVALGARDAIRRTATALLPFAGTNVVAGGGVLYRGAVDHHLGVLLVAVDERVAGIAHLRAAREMHERLGATRWAHRTASALALVDARPAESSMVRDGDVWTLGYATTTVRTKDSKGLRDLAMLLANPGVEIRATVLAGTLDGEGSADEVLDPRARAEIAARLRALESDLARADERGDQAMSVRAGAERDALVNELHVATGLAGRSRRMGDPTERARKAVSARLRDAIIRVEQQHPELGRHLRDSVVTGRVCSYQPASATHWVVRQNESGN